METSTTTGSDPRLPSPTAIVGAILGFGVIRMLSKERFAPQPRVSGPTREAPSPRHRPSAAAQTLPPPNRAD